MKVICHSCGWQGNKTELETVAKPLKLYMRCPECGQGSDDDLIKPALGKHLSNEKMHDYAGSSVENLLSYILDKKGEVARWGVGHKLMVGETSYRYMLNVFHEGTDEYNELEKRFEELSKEQES